MTQKPNPHSFEAIGTQWWVESLDVTQPLDDETVGELEQYASQFDQHYSRFITTSLLGQLNNVHYLKKPPKELVEMFDFAREMFMISEGAFNITVGGKLHELGYGSRHAAAPIYANPWQYISYDQQSITTPEDMTIDNGGYGKGWLIDAFAQILARRGYERFLINGGGDMLISNNEPIAIELEHPYDDTLSIGATKITKGALAVSGVAKRTWHHDSQSYHHLIDPFTEEPTNNGVAGVYVRASTALIADTMATILMIRPDLQQKLSDLYDLKVIIVRDEQLV